MKKITKEGYSPFTVTARRHKVRTKYDHSSLHGCGDIFDETFHC